MTEDVLMRRLAALFSRARRPVEHRIETMAVCLEKLEAAEREAEIADEQEPQCDPRAVLDTLRLDMLESRLAKLALLYEDHHHDCFRNGPVEGSTTGPLYG